ncbi:hypothetical protein Plhal304r1_c022g0076961 [Plasmopara halstedii]
MQSSRWPLHLRCPSRRERIGLFARMNMFLFQRQKYKLDNLMSIASSERIRDLAVKEPEAATTRIGAHQRRECASEVGKTDGSRRDAADIRNSVS